MALEVCVLMEWPHLSLEALSPRSEGPGQWRGRSSPIGTLIPALLAPFPAGHRVPAQPEGVTSRGGAGRLR